MERRAKLQPENVTFLDDLEKFRLEVSQLIAETSLRRGEPRSLIKAYRLLSIQMARVVARLFPLPTAYWGLPVLMGKFPLRC